MPILIMCQSYETIHGYQIMFVYLLCIFFIQTVNTSWVHKHGNYTLYQVTAFNIQERAILYSVHIKNDDIIFLNGVTNEAATPMYVIVPSCCNEEFEVTMNNNDIEYIIVHKESVLQEFKNLEATYQSIENNVTEHGSTINDKFLDWQEIVAWVEQKDKKFTLLRKIHIGATYENRELFVLKLSNGLKRPAVFILGGEQGRDWISPAIIMNFINNMLMFDSDIILIDYYDLYVMPVFNPDGYEYSIKEDRFWNKNRKHFYPEQMCHVYEDDVAIGVNIDRNWFNTNFSYITDGQCDSVYIGHKTLAEEEPKALSNFLNSIAPDLMAFINLKGFIKLITVPYADPNDYANNFPIMIEMLMHASSKAYNKYNVSYNICRTGDCLYNHTGNSPDWVKRNLNVPIVYTLYMKHEESFLPHLSQITKLTLHFATIVRESLLLANSIYGPLFNDGLQLCSNFVGRSFIIILLFKLH